MDNLVFNLYVLLSRRSTALAEPLKPLAFIHSLTILLPPLFLCALSNTREMSALMSVGHFTSLLHQVNHNLFCFCGCHAPQRKGMQATSMHEAVTWGSPEGACSLPNYALWTQSNPNRLGKDLLFWNEAKPSRRKQVKAPSICQRIHILFAKLYWTIISLSLSFILTFYGWYRWPVLPALIRQLLPVQIYLSSNIFSSCSWSGTLTAAPRLVF